MKHLLVLLFLISNLVSAQIENPLRFPFQNEDDSYLHSSICGLTNGDILFFWISKDSIYSSKSTDVGSTWTQPEFLFSYPTNYPKFISSVITPSERIILGFKGERYSLYSFSDDYGDNWSVPDTLPTSGGPFTVGNLNKTDFSTGDSGEIYFTYSINSNGIYYLISTDNGYSWVNKQISTTGSSGTIASINSDQHIIVYQEEIDDVFQIMQRVTTDNGATWSEPTIFLSSTFDDTEPKFVKGSDDKLWLFFNRREETPFEGFYQHDIKYTVSTDGGLSWNSTESFTNYKGDDIYFDVNLFSDQPVLSFSSTRNSPSNNIQLYYGIAGITEDNNAPPFVYNTNFNPEQPDAFEEIVIRCLADDEDGITSINIVRTINYKVVDTLLMFDDGLQNDSLANDKIYGINAPGLNPGDVFSFSFLVTDVDSNTTSIQGGLILIPLTLDRKTFTLDINRITLPIYNTGSITDSKGGSSYGLYDGKPFLFNGGFLLSGYSNSTLWANGAFPSARFENYQPGKLNSLPYDPKNIIYVVNSIDLPFSQSWQDWKYAVLLGADFYDGNNDGLYNPVDLNGNNVWDLTEDKPDMLGDVTTWCIYNDAIPRYIDAEPMGIEIQQTIFASGYNLSGKIESIVFLRYRIINKASVNSILDSVYFSIATDPDLGSINNSYYDDLVGADTLLSSGFAYNEGEDFEWGPNPPAFFSSLLQGSVSYIPGVTFSDNNSNNIYDPEIDTPIDTAFYNNGLFLGSEIFPGGKNLTTASFTHFFISGPLGEFPSSKNEYRNLQLGIHQVGILLDPCIWSYGEVKGSENCSEVNPLFWYSGDPVTETGWLNNYPVDQLMILNTGPFQLKENEPVDIWAAYVLGRGTDALNSITVARENVQYAIDYYNSNFTVLPVEVKNEPGIINSYQLFQNYPNPFNPVTTIRYKIPETGKVTLKVYDILGQEIKKLVNKEQLSGNYEVHFDGSNASSGIYFYELKTENFSSVKKMILVK